MNKRIYIKLIKELKTEILGSRVQAARLVNKECLTLYFKIGKIISFKIREENWGSKILDNISRDLQNNLPGLRGFSPTNLKYMRQFYETYAFLEIGQLATDQFKKSSKKLIGQSLTDQFNPRHIRVSKPPSSKKHPALYTGFINDFFSISFTHHYRIIAGTKTYEDRLFYIRESASNNWTVSTLMHNLEVQFHKRKGKIQSNFSTQLPPEISEKAIQAFKDEYLLDFINIKDHNNIDERVVEEAIVNNIKQFLLSLGPEFAFMGNQYRLIIGGEEFFVDLLFFHRGLKCLIAIDLKANKFRPEYGGKMAFYLEGLNKHIKLAGENPSIGIILCKEKNSTIVEYSFVDNKKPIGVGTYRVSNKLPQKLKKYLPPSEDLINIVNEPLETYN